jgi:hypothetical protein
MRDIKLTLSTDTKKRAPSIEEEKKWLDEAKKLWYPLGRYCPREAKPGC